MELTEFREHFHAKKAAQIMLNGITSEIREHGLSEALLREEERVVKALEEWELKKKYTRNRELILIGFKRAIRTLLSFSTL